MNGMSISFIPDIFAFAQTRGLKFTREEVEAISANLNSITTVEGTTATFTLGKDRVVPLDEAVAAMSTGYGSPAPFAAPAAAFRPGATTTERAMASNAAIQAGADAAKRDQAAALVRSFGNPWRTQNRTHQAYITNVAPEMASRLKQEAGGRA